MIEASLLELSKNTETMENESHGAKTYVTLKLLMKRPYVCKVCSLKSSKSVSESHYTSRCLGNLLIT